MSRAAGSISLGILLLLCVSFCLTELAEADLHWHLLAGREILRQGEVPRVDAFSYTSAGRPWVDMHWLFQVLVSGVHRVLGWNGLDLLKVTLVAGAISLAAVGALRRGASVTAVAAVLLPALVASQERFTLRPEAASFVLLAGLHTLLSARRHRPGSLLAVPPLLWLWANLHALYAVGVALVVLTFAGDLLERLGRHRGSRREDGPSPVRPALLLGVAAAGVAATAATPYGLAGWDLPGRLLLERLGGDTVYARNIAEFQAPFSGYVPTTAIAAFLLLTILVGSAVWIGRRDARLPDLLVLGAFLGLALLARRNVPLFALVAIPITAPLLGTAGRRIRDALAALPGGATAARAAPGAVAAVIAVAGVMLLGSVWSNRFYERDGTQRYFGRGPSPGYYPEGAADFVLGHRLAGEAIHDLATGGFLAWRWYPDRRVFIDGRLELHGEDLFASYLRMQADPGVFEELARRYSADVAVVPFRPEWAALLRHLAGPQGWRAVYVDHAAAVFVRRGSGADAPGAADVDLDDPRLGQRILERIREARAGSERRDPAPAWLRRLLPRRPVPVPETNAALFFGLIGRTANAELLFREALAAAPGNAVLHYDLGLVLQDAGRAEEARRSFGAAIVADPGFVPARVALAFCLLREGDEPGALREWDAAERRGTLGITSLQARGALRAARGRIDEAIDDYRKAVLRDPARLDLRADLAILYERRGLQDMALEEVERLRRLDPSGCAAGAVVGRMRAGQGRVAEAERLLRDLVAAAPGCAAGHLGLAVLLLASGHREEATRAAQAAVAAGIDPSVLSLDPTLRMLGGVGGGTETGPAAGRPENRQ